MKGANVMLCTGNAQLLEAAVACDEVFPARGRPGCAVTPELCQWFLGGPQLDWVVFSFFFALGLGFPGKFVVCTYSQDS